MKRGGENIKGVGTMGLVFEVAVLAAAVAIAGFYLLPNQRGGSRDGSGTDEKRKSTTEIPEGLNTYYISGNLGGPQTTSLTIDPLDAKAGETQNFWVEASDSNPISSVKIKVTLDNENKSKTTELSLSEGSNTEGKWSGSLAFPKDTMDYNYTITIIAVSDTGTTNVTTTIR